MQTWTKGKTGKGNDLKVTLTVLNRLYTLNSTSKCTRGSRKIGTSNYRERSKGSDNIEPSVNTLLHSETFNSTFRYHSVFTQTVQLENFLCQGHTSLCPPPQHSGRSQQFSPGPYQFQIKLTRTKSVFFQILPSRFALRPSDTNQEILNLWRGANGGHSVLRTLSLSLLSAESEEK